MTEPGKRALTAAGWLAGWGLISAWLAALCGWSVLLLTAGVACVAAAGLRPLGLLVWHGVYFLGKRGALDE